MIVVTSFIIMTELITFELETRPTLGGRMADSYNRELRPKPAPQCRLLSNLQQWLHAVRVFIKNKIK